MSFASPRNKRAANISSGSESKNSSSESQKYRKLQRKRSQIVSNSLRGSIPLLPDDLFPNLPQIKQARQAEKRLTQKSLPSVVTSKALAVAETRRAKTVFFYKDGDEYFTGVRVPINKGRFRTMDALMDSLNDSIPMPFGVRRLHTPNGKTPIRSLDELQPHGRYIAASSTRRVQGVDLEAVERRKRHREDAQRRWNFQSSPSTTTHGGSANTAQIPSSKGGAGEINNTHQDNTNMFQSSQVGRASRSRSEKLPAPEASNALSTQQRVNSTFMPVTSKQIYFVLNGNPHRFYRTLVSPLSRGELDHLLEEISEGLQVAIFRIYSFEGDRILNVEQLLQLKDSRAIAVPRHERLQLNGQTNSDILRPVIPLQQQKQSTGTLLLPPIKNGNNKSKGTGTSSSKSVPPYRGNHSKTRQPSNNIDRLPAYENLTRFDLNIKKKRMLNSTNSQDDTNNNLLKNGEISIRQRSFSSNNAPPVKMAASGAIKVKRKLTTLGPTKAKDTVNTAENTATTSSTITTTTTNTDSDSGRPRSTMEELENMPDEVNEEGPGGDGNDNVDGEEDDYPEEPPELMALHQMEKRRRKKSSKAKNEGEIGENEEEEEREWERREEEMRKEEEEGDEEGEGLDTVGDGMEDGREDETEDGKDEREEALVEVAMNEDDDKDEDEEENNEDEDEEVRRINKAEDMKEDGVEEVNEMDEVPTPPKIEEEGPKSPSPIQYTIIHTGGSNPEQGNEGGMSGVYSDELERILYGQAAVKIQSVWRGYTVRKGFKHTRFSEHPIYIGTGSYGPRRRSKNNLYKPNERHQAIITRVKTPKSGKRKTSFKKTSTTMLVPDYGNETAHDSSSDREEASVTELLQGKQRLGWEMSQDHIDKSPVNTQRTPRTDYLYTITVLTGNRWAADTEADLYVIMVGAGGVESERLWLRQEFTNWLQSGANGQRFRQNHSDSFQFRVPSRLGILKKLTIGHDCKGYGAGIFIDRIMVTEDEEASDDCRQFLFLCNKWLDSGQVDGKLERTIRLSSFYEISSIPIEDRVTRGRWELILHGGSEKGLGGTTSQLSITGYGTRAQSTTSGLYDSNMAKVPSDALIQLDFGDIGELLKVRVEIDGTGSSPDYFLNFVEFKDLDTEERFVVMCGKWLRWKSTKKGDQPFRELSAFHIGVEPLPLITYEGKISVQSTPKIECLSNKEVLMDLHGDLGETGIFRVTIAPPIDYKEKQLKSGDEENMPINEEIDKENENIDVSFKVEAVSVGRVVGARLRFEPNSIGEQILDGLLAIQGLFQKQGLWPLSSNSEFLCGRILLRESYHTPYRYVLTRSQFHELSEQTQFCTKELLTTEMEGVSTRLPRRKQAPKERSNWLLQVSLAYGSSILPEIELCGENGFNVRMRPMDTNCSDGMLSYQVPPKSSQERSEENDELFGQLGKTEENAELLGKHKEREENDELFGHHGKSEANAELFGQLRKIGENDELFGHHGKSEELDKLFGQLRKIRIFIEDEGKKLTGVEASEEENNLEDKGVKQPFTIVEKIRISDTVNGDEIRFPAAECHLQKYSVYELSAIWPDKPPIPIVIYFVRIVAGEASSQNLPGIHVRLNISGEYGDVGWRTLSNSEIAEHSEQQQQSSDNQQKIQLFAPNTRNSFEFEAVSIGHLEFAEMEVLCSDVQNFSWECAELIITDTNTALYYKFKFDGPFSETCRLQRCQTLPFNEATK